jgi:hypothetical protein
MMCGGNFHLIFFNIHNFKTSSIQKQIKHPLKSIYIKANFDICSISTVLRRCGASIQKQIKHPLKSIH